MGLARRMPRGSRERTQPKELRCTQYPQVGLTAALIPDAVNSRITTNGDMISINVYSPIYPFLYNSSRNGSRFIGASKGVNGYGVGGNPRFRQIPSKIYGKLFNQSSVNSFGGVGNNAVQYSISGSLTSIFNTEPLVFSLDTNLPFSNFPNKDRFELRKGGVASLFTQKRNNIYFNINSLNTKTKTNQYSPQDPVTVSASVPPPLDIFGWYTFRSTAVDCYGMISYFETNTNKLSNAAWLLNQKTQYQRKFNPLKNLGV